MLLNELNQTISDVYGLPVDPALLQLRSERTIVYCVGYSIPYGFKRSEDLLDYVVDMMKWLEAGEDIVSVLGWTDSVRSWLSVSSALKIKTAWRSQML